MLTGSIKYYKREKQIAFFALILRATNCVNLPDREYIVFFYFIMLAEGLVQALME